VIKTLLAALFDATWNAAHRGKIWASVVAVLFLSGFGLPFPEDVPLTLSGFTTYKQSGDHFIWWRYVITFGIVVVPVLAGDLVAYAMGRRWGWALRRFRFFSRLISDKGMARVQRWFHKYGSFAVFLGRQMAGVRFLTFYTAGTMRMNVAKFVLWDFVGCLVSIPVWLTLGTLAARFGQEWMEAARSSIGRWFVLGFVVGVGFLVAWMRLQKKDAADAEKPE
jgi:membrane protein DedA with SNARE-associated domain